MQKSIWKGGCFHAFIIAQIENLHRSILFIQAMDQTVTLPTQTINLFWMQFPPGAWEKLSGKIWLRNPYELLMG